METKLKLALTRSIKAPPSAVYRAWTDAESMKQWIGPENFDAVSCESEVRVGGRHRVVIRDIATGALLEWNGTYREIVQDRKLVFTFAWKGEPEDDTLCTVEFLESGGGTLMTFTQEPFADDSDRDSHAGGWSQAFDKLERTVLASA